MLALFLLLLPLLPLVLAYPAGPSVVVFPAKDDWWVLGAENTLVFNWTHKAGEPVTTLYNVNTDLMESPFFWESKFYVHKGVNAVNSSIDLVGAKPGDGYYLTIDVMGKHLTSDTFEIKAAGSALRPPPAANAGASSSHAHLSRASIITIACAMVLAFFSLGFV